MKILLLSISSTGFYVLPAAFPITQEIINITISIATIVEPTGVDARIDTSMPAAAQTTDITAEQRMTALKLLNSRMAESAGKIISAEMSSEPTRFIASTMTIAVIIAIRRL